VSVSAIIISIVSAMYKSQVYFIHNTLYSLATGL
jgi:hypothetical protein